MRDESQVSNQKVKSLSSFREMFPGKVLLFVVFVVRVGEAQAGCTPLSNDQLKERLGNGFVSYYMSVDAVFATTLQFNKKGICSSTLNISNLGYNYFPRYIRDIKCDNAGSDCMDGKTCQEVRAYMKVLKRVSTNHISFCDADGYERWVTITHPIGAGCECAVY